MNIILEGIVGSQAFGTARPDSDTDYLGVFVTPVRELVGLFPPDRDMTVTDASPEGDDHTYHELGKMFHLWTKANPTQLDLLFLNEYTKMTEFGESIIDNRHLFLSDSEVRSRAKGFMHNMMQLNTPKSRYHAIRVFKNTLDLMGWGEYDVRVNGREADQDPSLEYIEECIQEVAKFPSGLPDESNYEKINQLLLEIRLGLG